MNTKAFYPCGGGSNLSLGTVWKTKYLSAKWVDCEISGIPAPLCLHGWLVGEFMGWLGGSGGLWVHGGVVGGGVGGWRVHGGWVYGGGVGG